MKLAILADVHGNLEALDAVLADLADVRPDQVVQGGDLCFNGPHPAECLDRIRELGWPGVIGNMDRALEIMSVEPKISWGRDRIGVKRNDWLQALPMEWRLENRVALVHAAPGDLWKAVLPESDDSELRAVYGPLGARVAVYAHIHRPYVRVIGDLTVANTGSVGLPSDRDPRACYLVLDNGRLEHRRVSYDVERAVAEVLACGLPGATEIAEVYRTAAPLLLRRSG